MVSNKKPLNGFSRILTIDNNYAVSMDTCQICEQFHVGYPREAILVHCSSLYIYINDSPNCLNAASPRMFADDTNISFASPTLSELENVLNRELRNVNFWLKVNISSALLLRKLNVWSLHHAND